MKKMLRAALVLALMLLMTSCGAGVSEGGGHSVTLLAASVGKGDAILVKVDGYVCLIDTGKAYARGKVLSCMEALEASALDAVFITHTDDDHTGGLDWLAESDIPVGAWYASAMYTGVKEGKHPAARAAEARGQSVSWLRRGDEVPLGETGATFRVLAPSRQFDDKDDNNSLVMLLETAQGRILLTGDMELPEEAELLEHGDDLSCAVLKAPNHGDDDTLSTAFAQAARPGIALISTDSMEKPGTPDPGVVARLEAAGAAVYVTQDATLGVRITLEQGQARAENLDIGEPLAGDVQLTNVLPGDDIITLRNDGPDRDMTGWYLFSSRGDEVFAFPAGWVMPAGGTVTVGTRSSDGDFDLLWDDKKVVHKSKTDTIYLTDPFGRIVDAMDNGQ